MSTKSSSASSNWKSLQATLPPPITTLVTSQRQRKARLRKEKGKEVEVKQREEDGEGGGGSVSEALLRILQKGSESIDISKQKEAGKYLAIDCEMVGVGFKGSESVLARVSIVNYYGYIMLDQFVKPNELVTDYRTWVSGIKPSDLENAPSFSQVVQEVSKLIKDKILIGHAIHNDLQALLLSHPHTLVRDTSKNVTLRELARTKFPSLKKLTFQILGVDIQKNCHSSVDDARATMALYKTQKETWEQSLKSETSSQPKKVVKQIQRDDEEQVTKVDVVHSVSRDGMSLNISTKVVDEETMKRKRPFSTSTPNDIDDDGTRQSKRSKETSQRASEGKPKSKSSKHDWWNE